MTVDDHHLENFAAAASHDTTGTRPLAKAEGPREVHPTHDERKVHDGGADDNSSGTAMAAIKHAVTDTRNAASQAASATVATAAAAVNRALAATGIKESHSVEEHREPSPVQPVRNDASAPEATRPQPIRGSDTSASVKRYAHEAADRVESLAHTAADTVTTVAKDATAKAGEVVAHVAFSSAGVVAHAFIATGNALGLTDAPSGDVARNVRDDVRNATASAGDASSSTDSADVDGHGPSSNQASPDAYEIMNEPHPAVAGIEIGEDLHPEWVSGQASPADGGHAASTARRTTAAVEPSCLPLLPTHVAPVRPEDQNALGQPATEGRDRTLGVLPTTCSTGLSV